VVPCSADISRVNALALQAFLESETARSPDRAGTLSAEPLLSIS